MAKKSNLSHVPGFEELVEMHYEKVRGLVARVQDLYVRGLLNTVQADTYTRE